MQLDFILCQLEMGFAMMKLTLLSAAMMVGTVVDLVSIESTVRNVLALIKLWPMESPMLLLEMDFAMMKPTMFTVTMMALTVVDPQSMKNIVQNAHAMVS